MVSLPNGRLAMYGDDTWLKLFPGYFSRADGTSSFFVSVGACILHWLPFVPTELMRAA